MSTTSPPVTGSRIRGLRANALLATLVAWLSGTAFVGHQEAAASLAMALAAAIAMLCYALTIFILTPGRTSSPATQA